MNYEEQGAFIDATLSLFPNVAFSVNEDGLQDWDIDGTGIPRPTDQVIQDEVDRLQALEDERTARIAAAKDSVRQKISKTSEEMDEINIFEVIDELDNEELVTSVNKLDSDNALVYADGEQAVRDSSGGWYYTNTGGGNKINWYVYSQDLSADKQSTIGEMRSIWFDFFPRSDTTRIPFIAVYTVPQGDGNDGASWYRSRFVYELEPATTPWVSTNGVYGGHIMHVGENPNVFPQYPHHELTQAGYASAGPQSDDEVVMFFAIGSDSSEGAGGYNFAINNTGSEWNEGSIATVLNGVEPTAAPEVNTTQQDFYRQAVTDMNDALALTDNFIYRESEYKKILPPEITGTGQVNAFIFNLSDLYSKAKGWREDIIQTTVARFNAIKAGADATAWQAALDDNVFATPTEDAIAQMIDAINNQGDFLTTSDTSEYNGAPVVNSVYAYRGKMIAVVTQQLNQFWMDEQANSTMFREAERIKVGNSNSSYMHEQIIGNPQYEIWYKHVVDQFSDKMQAIYDATTYEEADTAFAVSINYDGPYAADQRPMPITWTDKTVGWGRRTAEATDPYNALQSARAKLVALGLTDNEALALCYYEGDDSRMLGEWT